MNLSLINLAYLASAILFILALKGLTHPRTAVRGNFLGAVGMLVAILATFADRNVLGGGTEAFVKILGAMAVGGAIGGVLAVRVQMTAMPQMVALLNGFGGAASALVAVPSKARKVKEACPT